MTKYGVIFDCDGTLVDSLTDALISFNYTLDLLGEPPRSEHDIKKHFGAGADRVFTKIFNGDEERGLKAFEIYVQHQTELAPGMKLHEGVRDMLEHFSAAGVPMAVVTGRHTRDMEAVLQPHAINHHFITLIADNHVPESKPAPHGIRLAAARMGLDPRNTLYVGDSILDMRAAHGAGSAPVAVLWDKMVSRQQMELERPAFFAHNPLELPEILKRFCGKSIR